MWILEAGEQVSVSWTLMWPEASVQPRVGALGGGLNLWSSVCVYMCVCEHFFSSAREEINDVWNEDNF